MTSLAIRRRVGPWLLGLFFLAQIVGIVPLIGAHLQHIIETQRDVAADFAEPQGGAANHLHRHHLGHNGSRHDHGVNDPNDQCCTLHHHLAGVVPTAAGGDLHSYLIAPPVAFPRVLLAEAEPGRLERPPKLPLSI